MSLRADSRPMDEDEARAGNEAGPEDKGPDEEMPGLTWEDAWEATGGLLLLPLNTVALSGLAAQSRMRQAVIDAFQSGYEAGHRAATEEAAGL